MKDKKGGLVLHKSEDVKEEQKKQRKEREKGRTRKRKREKGNAKKETRKRTPINILMEAQKRSTKRTKKDIHFLDRKIYGKDKKGTKKRDKKGREKGHPLIS